MNLLAALERVIFKMVAPRVKADNYGVTQTVWKVLHLVFESLKPVYFFDIIGLLLLAILSSTTFYYEH